MFVVLFFLPPVVYYLFYSVQLFILAYILFETLCLIDYLSAFFIIVSLIFGYNVILSKGTKSYNYYIIFYIIYILLLNFASINIVILRATLLFILIIGCNILHKRICQNSQNFTESSTQTNNIQEETPPETDRKSVV